MSRIRLQFAVVLGMVLLASAATAGMIAASKLGQGQQSRQHQASGTRPPPNGQATPDAVAATAPGATTTSSPTATTATAPPATATPKAAAPQPTATATPAPVSQPPPAPAAPAHFGTLAPGAALPSGAQCAAWVRARPIAENKRMNITADHVTGQPVGTSLLSGDAPAANQLIAPRIDGQFTGTTHEILRWAACKWGVDEDVVAAQAAVESWWRQTALGDFGTDPSRCPPGHTLGVDGQAGKCPESYGVLQNRYPYEKSTWPAIASSTAGNADTAYGIWRACYQGYETWLGGGYGAGDQWGCIGRWFSGRWHTAESDGYVQKVQGYLNSRIWETANFQEP
jgi:autotransporter family porin